MTRGPVWAASKASSKYPGRPASGRPAASAPGQARGVGWLASTAEFTARRITAGSRTWQEIGAMVTTSALIPPLAVGHWLAGTWRNRNAGPWPPPPRAVLFDRDGTLVHDVPYNTAPDKVAAMPGAAAAVAALRARGIAVGVVTNQSGVGQGRITPAQLTDVDRGVGELTGPFGAWQVCTHTADADCGCRKPEPGLIRAAADACG